MLWVHACDLLKERLSHVRGSTFKRGLKKKNAVLLPSTEERGARCCLKEYIFARGNFYPVPCECFRLFSALGTSSSYNYKLCDWENFTTKINKLRMLFNILSQRDLSVYCRITIAKTVGLSKLLFSSACICTPVCDINTVNRLEWIKAKN